MCHSGNDVVLCLLLTSAGVTRNDHLSDSWRNQDGSTGLRVRVRETSINTLVTILCFIYKLDCILAQKINNHIKHSYLCGQLFVYHLANFTDVNENYMRMYFKVTLSLCRNAPFRSRSSMLNR